MKGLTFWLVLAFFVAVGVIDANRGSRVGMDLFFGVVDAGQEVYNSNKRVTAPPAPEQ